jgi:DNA-binding MarR family transcriptional regulator
MIILWNNGFMISRKGAGSPITTAFLLSQIGGRSAQVFAKMLEPLRLAPADAGILRLVGLTPGVSQQQLARRLGMHASRLVAMIDTMEERGLVVRKAHASDRRSHALELSQAGREALQSIAGAARQHEQEMLAGLGDAERAQLRALLEKVAAQHGLAQGVHPGYRNLGNAKEGSRVPDRPGKRRPSRLINIQ